MAGRIPRGDHSVHQVMRTIGRGSPERWRGRRGELAAVRRRLDVLTARRLQGPWTDEEAAKYALMARREHQLLNRRSRPVRRTSARSVGSVVWSTARRGA